MVEVAAMPLSAFMGSDLRIVVRYRRADMFVDTQVCFAGELADDHPELQTFRAPELLELLTIGSREGVAKAHGAKAVFGGNVKVPRERVISLLEYAPALTRAELQALWKEWNADQRAIYNRLRRAALRWLGLDLEGEGHIGDRLAASSWAADRLEALEVARARRGVDQVAGAGEGYDESKATPAEMAETREPARPPVTEL